MNASELRFNCLDEEGIHYIFGVSSGNTPILSIRWKIKEKMRFVLARHKHRASFTAEVYACLKGIPVDALVMVGTRKRSTAGTL